MSATEATRGRRWFPHRKTEDRALTRASVPSAFFPETGAGPVVSPRGALAIADAYACVRLLSDAAASLPLHIFRRTASGGREHVVGGPTPSLFGRPAPGVSTPVLIAQIVAHLNLWGNAYLGLYRGENGTVQQLGLIPPERVVVRILGGLPLFDVTQADGQRVTVGDSDLIHIRGLTLDGLQGLSPVAQAREALGLSKALSDQGAASAKNGARLAGVLTVDSGPDEDDVMANLERNFSARHQGSENAGKFAVLTAAVSFTPVSMPLNDAQFLEQREFSTREVARCFRVPAWMIGGSTADSLTYSTVSEQSRAFVVHSLGPTLNYIESALALNKELFPQGSGLYPQFVLDGLLRGDPAARAAIYTQALNPVTGWMTRAEARALEDLPAETTPQEAPVA